ncbi:MAG: hypothetical protein K2X03_02260 [Bryobacteraceae bacterium]|nr:hypothetical protein [Bryobacteraceae bacterium]
MLPAATPRSERSPGSHTARTVVRLEPNGPQVRADFEDETSLTISRFLAGFIRCSDQIEFDPTSGVSTRELRIVQVRPPSQLYFAPIGYVTQPKPDKRDEYFTRALVCDSRLGIKHIHLPNAAVRDYFYFGNRRRSGCAEQTLYDLLQVDPDADFGALRLGLKVRLLELEGSSAPTQQKQPVERAFNLLAHPELRACYHALLLDADAPALFPYGGFGTILVAGELSRDRETFFARKMLSFLPERQDRRFRAPLRRVEFFEGNAVYRDSRRKVEIFLDPVVLPVSLGATWNQWRHLVSTKIGVEATFVKSGKYQFRGGEWRLHTWETALPSRIKITIPADAPRVVANAQQTHHRFGQFFDALEDIRLRLERQPIERAELARICDNLRIPPDFDIAQISWRANYDKYYYDQLLKRTRQMFLFRGEFIFELERTVVVEVPQQGHATYVFVRPANLDQWVGDYARTTKEEIRQNRANVAERLGFVGRIAHGRNPRAWLRELRVRAGEPVEYSLAVET